MQGTQLLQLPPPMHQGPRSSQGQDHGIRQHCPRALILCTSARAWRSVAVLVMMHRWHAVTGIDVPTSARPPWSSKACWQQPLCRHLPGPPPYVINVLALTSSRRPSLLAVAGPSHPHPPARATSSRQEQSACSRAWSSAADSPDGPLNDSWVPPRPCFVGWCWCWFCSRRVRLATAAATWASEVGAE
jgi:hypothetical protein